MGLRGFVVIGNLARLDFDVGCSSYEELVLNVASRTVLSLATIMICGGFPEAFRSKLGEIWSEYEKIEPNGAAQSNTNL